MILDLPYGDGDGDAGHLHLGGASQLYQLDRLDSWNIQSI